MDRLATQLVDFVLVLLAAIVDDLLRPFTAALDRAEAIRWYFVGPFHVPSLEPSW